MKTILYVDDDVNSIILFKEQLKAIDPNINILSDKTGKDGINTFKEHQNEIDLVIADIQLPNITGYDLLLLIKRISPKTHVIMVTASCGNRDYDYVIKQLGASEYLTKPISLNTLTKMINRY